MASIKDFLAQTEPFCRLSVAELERVANHIQEVDYKKGEQIYSEGAPADCLYVLRSGRVEIFRSTTSGKSTAFESVPPGVIFGTLCRLGATKQIYPCTAVVSEDARVVRVSDKVFLDLYRRCSAFVAGVCKITSEKLNMMQELAITSQEPVDVRIIKTLIKLSHTHGDVLPFTRREIADLSSTTTETAIRTLRSFSRQNWIHSTRGRIVIKNRNQLEAQLTT